MAFPIAHHKRQSLLHGRSVPAMMRGTAGI
jgi:hypothetical protein